MAIEIVPTWEDSLPLDEAQQVEGVESPITEEAIQPTIEQTSMGQPTMDQAPIGMDQIPSWEDSAPVATLSPNEDYQQFVDEALPTTLNFAGFDTGIEIPPEVSAGLVGMGYMMVDTYRGIKQIVGSDEEQMAQDQEAINKLFADERYGSFATAGAVAGALVEPVGFLVPAFKGAGVAKGIAAGAAAGATMGTLGYVDEAEGQTRLGNAVIGATLGGTIGGVIKTAPKAFKAIAESAPVKAIKTNQANRVLDSYELSWAKQIASGKTPAEARKAILAEDPIMGSKIKKAFDTTGRIPHTLVTQKEAEQIVELQKTVRKPIDIVLGTVENVKDGTMKGIDTIGGAVSTRIKNISEPVFHLLRTYEYNIRNRSHQFLTRTNDFSEKFNKLSENQQNVVHAALVNGDYSKVKKLYKSAFGDEGELAVTEVTSVLEDLGKELYKPKRIQGRIKEYFPRYINDRKGLLKSMDKEQFKSIRDELSKAASEKGSPLTPMEESDIINKRIIRPVKPGEGGPGFSKQRGFETVPTQFLSHYARPTEALHSYINNAIIDIEKAKFFGKGWSKNPENNYVDVTKSVGNFLREEIKSGDITGTEFDELSKLLNIRFGIGEKSAIKSVQDIKNVMYSSLLGNPISAVTQLGDVGVSIYMNGMKNTLSSVAETLTGKTTLKVKDFGLVDKLSEEFASTRGSAKILNNALRFGGFEGVDRLGKSTILNSSLKKYQDITDSASKLSQKARDKGMKELEEKYAGVFGDEFQLLVNDLKNKKITDNVKLMLFNELSDVQPISLSEMPQKYLEMPNGRVMYMFKTFLLKQFDILRRDSYNEIKKGNVRKGLANLAKYGAIIGTANTGSQYVKDWMLGRDVEVNLPMDVPLNFIKTLGWSEYTQNKLAQGNVSGAIVDFVTPPINIFDKIMQDPEAGMQFMPIVGRLYYNWFGGGIEAWNEKHGEANAGGAMFGEEGGSSLLFTGK